MPKINVDTTPKRTACAYPAPHDAPMKGRVSQRFGDAGYLTQFGVNIVTLSPGSWASQRHAHSAEDEFVYVIAGYPTLVEDSGETPLSPGDMCAHPAGDGNAHHLVNHSDADVKFLVIGTRTPEMDSVNYPDIDMSLPANGTSSRVFLRKDGSKF